MDELIVEVDCALGTVAHRQGVERRCGLLCKGKFGGVGRMDGLLSWVWRDQLGMEELATEVEKMEAMVVVSRCYRGWESFRLDA